MRNRVPPRCGPTGPAPCRELPPKPEVHCGPSLCRLEVWTEAEWTDPPGGRRPAEAARVPGLGWVVAVPLAVLN